MNTQKLGKSTDQRLALIAGQASDLLWFGRIETTFDRAKQVGRYAEKCITIALNAYEDVVTDETVSKDAKGKEKKVTISKDGTKKLTARRKLLALLEDRQEQKAKGEKPDAFATRVGSIKHPLIEKMFDEYAPKYARRAEELGQKGGYTRVIKTSVRRGDNAQLAIIELV
ncbi:MAG: L17 family ribosomal protein [Clostridia bacterium]